MFMPRRRVPMTTLAILVVVTQVYPRLPLQARTGLPACRPPVIAVLAWLLRVPAAMPFMRLAQVVVNLLCMPMEAIVTLFMRSAVVQERAESSASIAPVLALASTVRVTRERQFVVVRHRGLACKPQPTGLLTIMPGF